MPPTPPDDFELGEILDAASQPPSDPAAMFDTVQQTLLDPTEGPLSFEEDENGQLIPIAPEDDLMPAQATPEFASNLAEYLEESDLSGIASELLSRIEDDIESRKPWEDRYRRGMEMMGLLDDEMDDGPFPGASTAVMPIISEACVQFWARSLGEQVPSTGPTKAAIVGKAAPNVLDRGERVADYMNHEILYIDRGWYNDHSRMLFALPTAGSCFKKTRRDHMLGCNVSEYVHAEDFITNYHFQDLQTAPRYSHRIWRTRNEIRKDMVAGIYREVDLDESGSEELPETTQDRMEVSDFEVSTSEMDDARHEVFEVYCELDLPGFEDIDPQTGEPTGIALPYVVTIDNNSEKVLSIYRDWKEPDPIKRRRVCFTKYDYIPGPGFYALSLLHLIGGLQEAATGALRLIVDGSATASLQGGFVSKSAGMRGQDLTLEPGVWKKVDASPEDLAKAFFNPPLREPSGALFNVLGTLTDRAEKFTATTEMMTGGTNSKNMPVGSTLAMLEQGGKVFSAIHRGLHRSLGEELRQRYELIQEHPPVEGYPYAVDTLDQGLPPPMILAEDFAPGFEIVPVSDPNIFSQEQRSALNQAVYELAMSNPDLIKRDVALRRVLEGMKVPDVDELFITHEPPPPMDPISEVQAILRGEPVQAYPEQDHQAHMQHYMAFLQNPQFGGSPQVAENVMPAAMSLIGQRLAYAWATHARALGAPASYLPPPMSQDEQDSMTGNSAGQESFDMQGQMPSMMDPSMTGQAGMPSMPDMGIAGMTGPNPAVPPEVLAQVAAEIAPQMAQVPGLPSPQAQAEQEAMQAQAQQQQAKAQAVMQKAQTDQEKAQADIQLKTMETQAKLELERMQAAAKQSIEEMKAAAKIQIEQIKAAQDQDEAKRKQAVDTVKAYADAREGEAKLRMQTAKDMQDMELKEAKAQQKAATDAAKAAQDQQIKAQDSQSKRRTSRKKEQ